MTEPKNIRELIEDEGGVLFKNRYFEMRSKNFKLQKEIGNNLKEIKVMLIDIKVELTKGKS